MLSHEDPYFGFATPPSSLAMRLVLQAPRPRLPACIAMRLVQQARVHGVHKGGGGGLKTARYPYYPNTTITFPLQCRGYITLGCMLVMMY